MSLLPTPRGLLTSLFNSLPHLPPPPESALPSNTNSNPLKSLCAADRSLIVTLHVLLPSLLLQALDLLDRGLVTRIVQVTPSVQGPEVSSPQAHIHLPAQDAVESDNDRLQSRKERDHSKGNTLYLVRSAQSTYAKSGSTSSRYGTDQGNSYVVRLTAWNCNCAAFAFSAFPASTSAPFTPLFGDQGEGEGRRGQAEGQKWEFGGLSFDGREGGGEEMPCCKHLLACLLIERWEGVLGAYVKERAVGKEEMAGIGAEG